MKTSALDLVILDDNTIMAGPLSTYLQSRFGKRVNISTFYDAVECMGTLDAKSHVIILSYFINGKDKENGSKNGLNTFNLIKKQNPDTDVTMITSDGDLERATQEMQRGACEYIVQREQYLYDILRMLNTNVLIPIKTIVVLPLQKLITLPVRRIIHYYSVKEYLTMFVIAFVSVGILVLVGFLSADFFR